MEFKQKDELGLERTYYEITRLELDNEEYIVYTDLLPDETRELRLLIGQLNNGKVIRVEEELEKKIIGYFTKLESNFKEYIKEML